jgi:hypothetical protein
MPNSGNLLLASLSDSDAAALQPHLQSVQLEHEKILFEAGSEATDVFFPTGAIVSLVVSLTSGEIIEAAMVGKDGVVGAFAALGGNIPANRAIVQLAGPALTCKVSELKSAASQSQSIRSALFRHEQAVYAHRLASGHDRGHQRLGPNDVHNPGQIVGQDREGHFGGDFWEGFGQEVRRTHARLHGAERMLDGLAT